MEKIDDVFAIQQKVMASEMVRAILADHHDLVDGGRRDIYRMKTER